MFMYLQKNWDLGFDWDLEFEIGIWGLYLVFGLEQWDLEFDNMTVKDLRFLCKIGI